MDLHDLATKMQKIALEESARFVMEPMAGVHSFDGAGSLMEHALQQADLGAGVLVCEFGVGSDGSIARLAGLMNSRPVYGFDSFAGLPETWRDGYEQGHFKLNAPPSVAANVELVIGLFSEALPGFLARHPQPVGFVHFDCDLYTSTKAVLDGLTSQMRRHTVLLFDEFFNYPGWRGGEYRAFCEFIEQTGFEYEWLGAMP